MAATGGEWLGFRLHVPAFFVLMGIRTDLAVFAQGSVLALAAALTVVAVIGKLACALGVLGKGRGSADGRDRDDPAR